jgi:hypothetical protein
MPLLSVLPGNPIVAASSRSVVSRWGDYEGPVRLSRSRRETSLLIETSFDLLAPRGALDRRSSPPEPGNFATCAADEENINVEVTSYRL